MEQSKQIMAIEEKRQAANDDLNKAKRIISDLLEDYSFAVSPNLQSVADFVNGKKPATDAEENSAKWIWEYPRIVAYMDMVHDYIVAAETNLIS